MALFEELWEGLAAIEGVTLYGPAEASHRGSALSLTVDGFAPGDVAAILDSSFGIAARSGLHCAPRAHRSIGTFPAGTVRLSPGGFNTSAETKTAVEAIESIAGSV
jgi:selenocysteine lyase/cysteine desulfurase